MKRFEPRVIIDSFKLMIHDVRSYINNKEYVMEMKFSIRDMILSLYQPYRFLWADSCTTNRIMIIEDKYYVYFSVGSGRRDPVIWVTIDNTRAFCEFTEMINYWCIPIEHANDLFTITKPLVLIKDADYVNDLSFTIPDNIITEINNFIEDNEFVLDAYNMVGASNPYMPHIKSSLYYKE